LAHWWFGLALHGRGHALPGESLPDVVSEFGPVVEDADENLVQRVPVAVVQEFRDGRVSGDRLGVAEIGEQHSDAVFADTAVIVRARALGVDDPGVPEFDRHLIRFVLTTFDFGTQRLSPLRDVQHCAMLVVVLAPVVRL
jgi:hypothetical protein